MTEVFDMSILELVSRLICYECCTCEDGEIAEHFFFLVTESWSLDTEDSEDSLELIEYYTRKSLAVDIIGYDDELSLAALCE